MAKKIKMHVTAAFPWAIFHEGKTYLIENDLAEKLCADGSGSELNTAAGELTRDGKVVKPQSPPDPGEVTEGDETEDDDTPE